MSVFRNAFKTLESSEILHIEGRVVELRGLSVVVDDLPAAVGSSVTIFCTGHEYIRGEVVGFTNGRTIVMTLEQGMGIRPGDRVCVDQQMQTISVSETMLGRVINALGQPIDGLPRIRDGVKQLLYPEPYCAMNRARVDQPIRTGVRAIDLMTPIGKGQRMGIFAGPGVGKSTLLSQIARGTDASVNVIALIGERGREVREFIEDALGEEGRARSIVVVSTSDEAPLMRIRASRVACSIAEYFRDSGRDVLLMMDSITRFAHAQRQVGLSIGEPPSTRGYTPSVFSNMASLLERAGASERSGGSITGLYTVLVEGDDMSEPIADASRGILDGHILLSRDLASKGQYPAIDILDSVSRVANQVSDDQHQEARRTVVRLEAKYREIEELLLVGAYTRGVDAETDLAVDFHQRVTGVLTQHSEEVCDFDKARMSLTNLVNQVEAELTGSSAGDSAHAT